ncbi:hypothetical protein [Desulfosporosinus sp. Sb-LF]|nr:hypothetical protein [Desulfosporosinus sp. Sb-LF]
MDIEGLKLITQNIVKTAVKNKAFEHETIDEYMIVSIVTQVIIAYNLVID